MIKNVVFDLGNVVLKLKWESVINRLTQNFEERSLLNKAIFDSKEWQKLDEGTISVKEAILIMKSNLPENLHFTCEEIMQHWTEGLEINTDILDYIEKLRENGYKTYILSNAPHRIPLYLKEKDLDKFFDGKVISAEIQLLKPNKDIYKFLLNKFSLEPSETFFIDDRKENIEAAINVGLHGHVFDYNNFNALEIESTKLGIRL